MNLVNQQVCWNACMVRLLDINCQSVVGLKLSVAVFKLVLLFVAGP